MKRFPKTIYVKYEDAGDEEPYLVPAIALDELAETSAHVRIAIYELKELAFVSSDPVITGRKAVR